ncbi:transketolase family protein [Candidatus Wolfebacteria bacterium]|nr:transketolase family protein [Candidatus Wolfebacteria bacterium]
MINKLAKLNKKIFEADIEQKPTRDGYGEGLLIAGEENKNIVVLCADLKESTRSLKFAEKFPERFIEMGVAEQNMAAVAAGLGISGKIPFISSYAVFSPGRNWEQIRTTIAYNDSNVKICGAHAGVSVGPDGATHQAIEDIAITRVIPGMKVIVPVDALEAKKAVIAASKIWGPVYLRFGREKTPIMTTEDTPFTPGKAYEIWSGKKPQVAIIGAGPVLHNALLAAKELEKEKISVIVLNCHTVKPIDEKKIIELAKKCGAVVAVEEHSVIGGLGGAIAEVLAKNYPVPMEFVGMRDVFGQSGDSNELIEKYGMGVYDIIKSVKNLKGRNNYIEIEKSK